MLAIAVSLWGRSATIASHGRNFQILRHNVNQVEICVSNYGTFGQDATTGINAGCWWPIGTTNTYIFGAGLWFGTIDSLTGDTLVSEGYLPCGGAFEFAPGLSGMAINHPDAVIYLYPTVWPPNPYTYPMAPQMTLSHQDSWCCFNDSSIIYHIPGDTRPIGLEVYQTVHIWNQPAIEDVVWFFYDVKNVSDIQLKDCYISVFTDCDVGDCAIYDLCSGIVFREYIIGTDTTIVDDVGYQWRACGGLLGTIGFDLLQTPFDLVPGNDKDGDGILDQYERDSVYYVNNLPMSMWDVDGDGVPDWRDASENPQIGMTAFKQFIIGTEPQLDAARYMTLAGYNHQTGIYEPYDTLFTTPDNQLFLMSSGPFDLDPDSVVTFAFAIFFADWYNIYQTPDTALVPVDETVQLYYDMYWYLYTGIKENCEFRISDFEMRVLPNPITGRGVISYSVPRPTCVSLKIYNVAGQLARNLLEEHVAAGYHTLSLLTQGLPHGMYFLVLETPDESKSQPLIVMR